ncbi:acylneuraminate cytidylyltransferase family protein [Candidatus Methylomirabilis sp.]|uniref:acylneuraminate cytidylyltransferase family protein n=1 Tax=Candidatus Methylomirabilis sp. TaxID=2032687 RepID=UPI002A654983|nr:acylneuraminate cytidylyltransferase family protein [Candidatus Methylomirabilis sp.]
MVKGAASKEPATLLHDGTAFRIVGIIPARGGSKEVPRKNIKLLAGQPLLTYMLSSALGSRYLTRVVVSSDDDEILRVAAEYGGEDVCLKRPRELAEDDSPDVPMLQHAVREIEQRDGVTFDYVVQLHATTPFMTSADIDGAMKTLLDDPEADSGVSVFQVNSYHPIKLKKIVGNRLEQYVEQCEEKTTSRRQDFLPVYKRNGGLYASKRSVVMTLGRVWGDRVLPYVMPDHRSLEIDSPTDFLLADLLMRHIKANGDPGAL